MPVGSKIGCLRKTICSRASVRATLNQRGWVSRFDAWRTMAACAKHLSGKISGWPQNATRAAAASEQRRGEARCRSDANPAGSMPNCNGTRRIASVAESHTERGTCTSSIARRFAATPRLGSERSLNASSAERGLSYGPATSAAGSSVRLAASLNPAVTGERAPAAESNSIARYTGFDLTKTRASIARETATTMTGGDATGQKRKAQTRRLGVPPAIRSPLLYASDASTTASLSIQRAPARRCASETAGSASNAACNAIKEGIGSTSEPGRSAGGMPSTTTSFRCLRRTQTKAIRSTTRSACVGSATAESVPDAARR